MIPNVNVNVNAPQPLHGLVAAVHTPFDAEYALHLPAVELQAAHLLNVGISTVFINGTTGECKSLTLKERKDLVERWAQVAQGSPLRLVVHVGSDSYLDAAELARHAEAMGVSAVSAFAPCYFKPRDVEALVSFCARIASAAPALPFYFYDIPALTGVHFSMVDFLEKAATQIPNLAGLKFTNPDLMAYQACLHLKHGSDGWDLPFGVDEHLLGALAMGGRGAVGSGFNFAAPIYLRLMAAFHRGEMASAREEQYRGAQMVQILARYGYLPAAKAVMKMLGVDVGPARLPLRSLTPNQSQSLHQELEDVGYFDWIE